MSDSSDLQCNSCTVIYCIFIGVNLTLLKGPEGPVGVRGSRGLQVCRHF